MSKKHRKVTSQYFDSFLWGSEILNPLECTHDQSARDLGHSHYSMPLKTVHICRMMIPMLHLALSFPFKYALNIWKWVTATFSLCMQYLKNVIVQQVFCWITHSFSMHVVRLIKVYYAHLIHTMYIEHLLSMLTCTDVLEHFSGFLPWTCEVIWYRVTTREVVDIDKYIKVYVEGPFWFLQYICALLLECPYALSEAHTSRHRKYAHSQSTPHFICLG